MKNNERFVTLQCLQDQKWHDTTKAYSQKLCLCWIHCIPVKRLILVMKGLTVRSGHKRVGSAVQYKTTFIFLYTGFV